MEIDISRFSGLCDCGRVHELAVKEIYIEEYALLRFPELFETGMLRDFRHPVMICDTNTYLAAGKELYGMLKGRGLKAAVLSSEGLHADHAGVAKAERELPGETDLILAVGAGTIHDISRYLAHKREIPFVSVPTAASVDGFVSSVAAMTWNGFKTTLPAVPPILVAADTRVFSTAPYRLTASGISDLLGKYTALADWKIAHLLTGEYFCPRIFSYEMDAVNEVRDCMPDLASGSPAACEKLMYALLLSGLAMQMCGNSRPASGAEHHVSHLWEMEVIQPHVEAYHGEKVSIGLVMVSREYEKIRKAIQRGELKIHSYAGLPEKLLQDTFGARGMTEGIVRENTPDPCLAVKEERLREALPEIEKVLAELPDQGGLLKLMKGAGCKVSPSEIGIREEILPLTLRLSPFVRNRLTFMRVINEFM